MYLILQQVNVIVLYGCNKKNAINLVVYKQ